MASNQRLCSLATCITAIFLFLSFISINQTPRITLHFDSAPQFDSSHFDSAPHSDSSQIYSTPRFDSSQIDSASRFHSFQIDSAPRFHSSQTDSASQFDSSHIDSAPPFYSSQINSAPRFDSSQINSAPQFDSSHFDSAPKSDSSQIDSAPRFHSSQIDSAPRFNSLSINPLFTRLKLTRTYTVQVQSSLQVQSPNLQAQSPNLQAQSPSLQVQSPILQAQSPSIQVQSPSLQAQSPNLQAQSPSLQVQSPSLQVQSPSLQTQSSLQAQSPSLQAQSPSFQVQSPSFQTQSSLQAQSPSLQAQSPSLQAQLPSLQAQSPSLQAQSGFQYQTSQDSQQDSYISETYNFHSRNLRQSLTSHSSSSSSSSSSLSTSSFSSSKIYTHTINSYQLISKLHEPRFGSQSREPRHLNNHNIQSNYTQIQSQHPNQKPSQSFTSPANPKTSQSSKFLTILNPKTSLSSQSLSNPPNHSLPVSQSLTTPPNHSLSTSQTLNSPPIHSLKSQSPQSLTTPPNHSLLASQSLKTPPNPSMKSSMSQSRHGLISECKKKYWTCNSPPTNPEPQDIDELHEGGTAFTSPHWTHYANTGYSIINGNDSAIQRLPNVLIIGAKKSGTRALLAFLRIHPMIRASGPELHYFDRYYARGLDWYRSKLPTSLEGQLTVEKTPAYLTTPGVPARVKQDIPNVKLLLVVRDPVTRALSDYTQSLSKHRWRRAFDDLAFIMASPGLVNSAWGPISGGLYAKHLDRWLQYFHKSSIHVISGENLIRDPAAELCKVQEFLGLRKVITEKHFFFNVTKGFPCLVKREKTGKAHCLGSSKGRTHPRVNASTLMTLRDFYRPFNYKFYKMVGQNFRW